MISCPEPPAARKNVETPDPGLRPGLLSRRPFRDWTSMRRSIPGMDIMLSNMAPEELVASFGSFSRLFVAGNSRLPTRMESQ